MEKENDKWINCLKNRLQDYSEPVAKESWDKIEKRISQSSSYKGHKIILIRYVAAAACIVIALMVGLYTYRTDDIHDNLSSNHKTIYNKKIPAIKVEPMEIEHISPSIGIKKAILSNQITSNITKPDVIQSYTNSQETNIINIDTTQTNNQEKIDVKKKIENSPYRNNYANVYVGKEYGLSDETEHSKGLSISAYGKFSGANTNSGTNNINVIQSTFSSSILMLENGINDGASAQTFYRQQEYSYEFPVTFGININKTIYKKLSLESGISFTRLVTKFKNDKSSSQKLWYIGIPVKVYYPVLERDIFNIYTSAGGAIEKCISAKYSGNYTSVSESDIPLQLSVNIAAGGEIKLSNSIYFYIEPGFSYFFKREDTPASFRTKHPSSFSINGGIRFNL